MIHDNDDEWKLSEEEKIVIVIAQSQSLKSLQKCIC